jgi:hypothetical protein
MPETNNALPVPQQELAERAQASWRNTLAIHPACAMFGPLLPDELRALGEDIIKNGLRLPIALWTDGRSPAVLVDGRNRLDAIELVTGSEAVVGASSIMAGEDFLACDRVITLDKSVDPWVYVVSVNLRRRHLNSEERAELIATIIARSPQKSDRQIAKEIGVDHKTVGAARAKGEDVGRIPHVSTRTDTKGRNQPTRKTTTKPPPVLEEVLQQRAAAAERIRAHTGGAARDETSPESSNDITSDRHFEFQNTVLRSEVAELKTKVRDLENRALQAVSVEQLVAELERRPAAVFLRKHLDAIRRALDVPGRHLGPTLEHEPGPNTDSEVTKH